jgi:radical SAM protein with 4Fe4S-binding SPASM domain
MASPSDPRITHDRLTTSIVFGTPKAGRDALDHMIGLVERIGETGTSPEAMTTLARDIADVMPLVLARFGGEDLVGHLQAVAEISRRLLTAAAALPQDGESAALNRATLDLLWTYDDPRTRTTRHIYRPRSPHTVQIEPTNRCNLKCTMCPRTTAMQRPLVDMPFDRYVELLAGWSGALPKFKARVHAFGPTHVDFAWPGFVKLFFLGEILMHENFAELAKATRERGAVPVVMTNAALLVRRSIRRKIVESDIQHLGISLDGIDEASYATIRSGATWPAVRDGILALCSELEAAGRRSAVILHVNSLVPEGPGMDERNRLFLAPVLERVDSFGQSRVGAPTYSANFIGTDGRMQEVVHHAEPIKPAAPSCFETLTKLNVLSDGRMTPCCVDIDGTIELGRMSQTIDEVWNSPATLALHRAHFTHRLEDYEYCRECLAVDVDPLIGLVPRQPLEATRSIG